MKNNRNTITDILILVLVTVIAYWPISLCIFSLKNDSLVQYLPFRYHLSEAIQHGYFPFWTPYLYTGFPIHADLQGMTWNPIVLIISFFTRYNMSVLELEVTIYLFIGAAGMYSLLKSFSCARLICIVGAISYMSCGFINGSASVIPWISSAAFIPFVFKYLKVFLERQRFKTSVLFALSLSLLFVCCYPTFFIYTCYIILAIMVAGFVMNVKRKQGVLSGQALFYLVPSIIIFVLLCAPAIISYWDFLPYYSRGAGITLAKAAQNPFTPFSTISYIFPNAVNKDHRWLETDPSMRNSYIGLFVFLAFCISFRKKYSAWQRVFLGITLFSFILSLGNATPLHGIAYKILPMFNTFRHPANIRLFTSIGMILLAALYVQHLLGFEKSEIRRKLLQVLYIITAITLLVMLYCLFSAGTLGNIREILQNIKSPKTWLDQISFNTFLLFQALAQFIFVLLFIFFIGKTIRPKFIAILIAVNSIIFCWIALPFTFITQERTKTINNYVNSFPDGYPLLATNTSVKAGIISDSVPLSPYGYVNFYTKDITIQDHVITPTMNKAYEEFCGDLSLRKQMNEYPFVYLADTALSNSINYTGNKKIALVDGVFSRQLHEASSGEGTIALTRLTPNSFAFNVNSSRNTMLCLFQQYNVNWEVSVNGETGALSRMNIAFMGTNIPKGKSEVVFTYKPRAVINAMYVAVSTLILLFAYFIFATVKQKRN